MSEELYKQEQPSGRPNKSALKRELLARGELIDRMTGLTDKELARLGVDEEDIAEIAKVRAIKPSGARNRQLKYATRSLSEVDFSVVETYLDDRHSQQLEINQVLHELERWRDRLCEQGDAVLGEAMERWPQIDRQRLRQLVRDAQREHQHGKPAGAKRKLFRYLREFTQASA